MIDLASSEGSVTRIALSRGRSAEVWSWSLRVTAVELYELSLLLSDEERARADAYVFPRHRDAFIVAHGEMRRILGNCTATAPKLVRLSAGSSGKPRIDGGTSRLFFNLSHSGERALLAIGRDAEVGVDLEAVSSIGDPVDWNFLTDAEHILIAGLHPSLRLRAGLRLWTRKEAILKALGCGLLVDPKEVCVLPDEVNPPMRGLSLADRPTERVSIRDLSLGPDYVGALAYA